MDGQDGVNPGAWSGDENDPREQRIGELLNEFLDRAQAGEGLSVDDFVGSHPDFADDLRRHLDGLRILNKLGSSADDQTKIMARDGSSARGPKDGVEIPVRHVELPELDGYEVVREIGRGGMGVVYKAMQKSTKRAVALKVLLEGPFASEAAQRRFEREIELAAQLRHPNIIPIYDSGRTAGRMYYAMEYVHGRPLVEYTKAQALGMEERLRLFQKICAAVVHAHLRSVVHRDLKPGNILVDADGEPRVHDFGLAKLGGVTDMKTSVSAQIVGTPAYMAPEQLAGDPMAIDARTDIYSLGVILYEMMTGKMPYPTDVPLTDVLNHIARTEPQRPSRCDRRINADLDTIVLKALAKRKDDRYQSVAAFADDIGRYLGGQPIEARRAGAIYVIGKALWPHRYIAASIAVILLLGATLAYTVLNNRLIAERNQLESKRHELELQREADQRVKEAELKKEQEFAEFVNNKMKDLDPAAAQRFLQDAANLVRNIDLRRSLMRTGVQAAREVGQQINRLFVDSPGELSTATQQSSQQAADDEDAEPTSQPAEPPALNPS